MDVFRSVPFCFVGEMACLIKILVHRNCVVQICGYDSSVGQQLRKLYQNAKNQTEQDFEQAVGYDKIQLIPISRPSAYGEYEPYRFVDIKEEFAEAVGQM